MLCSEIVAISRARCFRLVCFTRSVLLTFLKCFADNGHQWIPTDLICSTFTAYANYTGFCFLYWRKELLVFVVVLFCFSWNRTHTRARTCIWYLLGFLKSFWQYWIPHLLLVCLPSILFLRCKMKTLCTRIV